MRKSKVEIDFSITFSQHNQNSTKEMTKTNQPLEIWKDIPGYEGYYQASTLGQIRSLDRKIIYKNGKCGNYKGKILKNYPVRGYLKLILRKDSKIKNFQIHKLVAMAFLGHIPCGHKKVVDHIDNNPLNNCLYNLQIITPRQNLTKDKKRKTSNYSGVHWCKKHKKFISSISIKGRQKSLGYFDSEIEASNKYLSALYDYENFNIIPEFKVKTSKYTGVCFVKNRNRWNATITIKGNKINLGNFKTELEAHQAYQLKNKERSNG